MKKKIGLAVIAILVIIQFIRPSKNVSDDRTYDVSTKYTVSAELGSVLQAACNDCHTNKTEYPWYSNIQPLGWWINQHVTDGKRHLNLATFASLPVAVQNHKFEEIGEMMEEDEMPLPSYTWMGMHPQANLTADQKKLIIEWAHAQMEMLKSQYPADSLVMKRRSPPPAGS